MQSPTSAYAARIRSKVVPNIKSPSSVRIRAVECRQCRGAGWRGSRSRKCVGSRIVIRRAEGSARYLSRVRERRRGRIIERQGHAGNIIAAAAIRHNERVLSGRADKQNIYVVRKSMGYAGKTDRYLGHVTREPRYRDIRRIRRPGSISNDRDRARI